MVATITKEEEELLIITDDEETTTTEINLDISDNKEPEVEWDIISFWWEEDSKNDKTEIVSNIWSDGLDFNFNLGWDEKEVTVEDMLWNKEENFTDLKNETEEIEEVVSEDIFNLEEDKDLERNKKVDEKVEIISENNDTSKVELNFWEEITEDIVEDNILNLEKSEKTIKNKKIKERSENIIVEEISLEEENILIKWDWDELEDNQTSWKGSDDTNTILNETIKKLQARKKEIVDIKKETLDNISELKDEIKILQWSVRKANTEVKHYDKETEKIEENIKMLRKMKI